MERLRFKRERRSVNRDIIGIGAIARRISHGEDLVAFLELSRSRGPGADFLHDARHVPTTIRLESSLLKDFVRCLSIAARHAARLRRTQTERRVSIGLTVLARNGRSAIASPGAWYDGAEFTDFHSGAKTRGSLGFYGLFDQVLVPLGNSGSNRGLGIFGSATVAPEPDIQQLPLFLTAGVSGRGLFDAQDYEIVIFALLLNFTNTT